MAEQDKGASVSTHAATLKLKPVIRKPVPGASALPKPGLKLPVAGRPSAPAGGAPAGISPSSPPEDQAAKTANLAAMDQLKAMTQKLKGVTQELPAQAILHKTGIIADSALTEAQKQASKSRTARISLSDAIGAAPVKNDARPMKTIRIKRPIDLPSAGSPASLSPKPADAPAPAAPQGASDVDFEDAPTVLTAQMPAPSVGNSTTITQKKTLKISRPGGVRPAPKFGIKKPGSAAVPAPGAAGASASPDGAGAVADIPEIADIPDMTVAAGPSGAETVADVPKGVAALSISVQIAASAAMGFLVWQLYQAYLMPMFVGGCQ